MHYLFLADEAGVSAAQCRTCYLLQLGSVVELPLIEHFLFLSIDTSKWHVFFVTKMYRPQELKERRMYGLVQKKTRAVI